MPRRLSIVAALVTVVLVVLPGLGRCWLLCGLQDLLAPEVVDTCCAHDEKPTAPLPVDPACACDDDLPAAVLPILDLPVLAALPGPLPCLTGATPRTTVTRDPILRARAPPGLASLRCVVLLI